MTDEDNGQEPTGIAYDLAALISAKPVTALDLEATVLLVLDAVANIIAGTNSAPGKIFLEWANDFGCLSSTSDPGRAALVLGAFCHILEMDDLHRTSVVHPGCAVVPAVMALARYDKKRASDGTHALRAILNGIEAATRVGAAVGAAHYTIWHNTATCGPFGSAMATATWLGLDRAACTHAIANAGTQSAGLWQFLETGAMSKHLHAGRAAEAGVVAATLAARGFTGAAAIFEGERGFFAAMCPDGDPAKILSEPDAPWQVHETSIKPWPSCRHTHPAIDAAIEARATLQAKGGSLSEISEIGISCYQSALDLCDNPNPQNAYEAKFSLQHCIAAALTFDKVDFSSFEGSARNALTEVRNKVTVTLGPAYESAYPAHWGCALEVTDTDGHRIEFRRTDAVGDPEAALSRDRLIEKARMLMQHGGLNDCDGLIDTILNMAHGGPTPELPL